MRRANEQKKKYNKTENISEIEHYYPETEHGKYICIWSGGWESIKSPKGFVTWKWNGNHIIISRNQCLMCAVLRRRRRRCFLLLFPVLTQTHKIMFVNICTHKKRKHEQFSSFSNFWVCWIYLCGKGCFEICTLEFGDGGDVVVYMAPLKCDEYWAPFILCELSLSFSLHMCVCVCVDCSI